MNSTQPDSTLAPPPGPTPGRRCVHCGYDLRGLATGAMCPECGREIVTLSESPIPWTHRKIIGRLRGFWRTITLATFRPRMLREAATLPVDYADAQQFRRFVIFWIWLGGCLAIGSIYYCIGWHDLAMPMFDPSAASLKAFSLELFFVAGALLPPVPMIGLLITLVLGSTSAGFFARPKNVPVWLRNRAVALTRYTLAPLVALPIVMAAAATAGNMMILNVSNDDGWKLLFTCYLSGSILLPICLGFYIVNTLRVSAGVLHCGVGRVIATLVGMAAIWLGAAVIGFGLFTLLAGYGRVVFESLK